MQIKTLLQDEDAVSPVIGVILMVAITVILAAVIGTFVLGLGDQVQSSAPNANFNFEYGGDFSSAVGSGAGHLEITHSGGQDIDPSNVEIQFGPNTVTDVTSSSSNAVTTDGAGVWEDPIETGAAINVTEDTDATNVASGDVSDVEPGDTVRIVWQSDSGGSSNTIGESTVPS